MGRPVSEPLPSGAHLDDKYVIIRHIKSGGMGAVYEVEHERLGKRLAAKVLLPELLKRPALVERFRREARAASATGHENIVQVTDLGETKGGVPFLVMELLEGRTLGAELKDGRLKPERAVHITRQILSALQAAHARSIVHRDLKPENIFLVQRGQDPDFVKVLDFGIAKVLDDDDDAPDLTETGQVVGTPSYMAPEQAKGGEVDHRVDIYAAGAMLYRMVTGVRPFVGPNFNALIFLIAQGNPKPPRELAPEVSEGLERIIAKAMHVDPAKRFQSVIELDVALSDDDATFVRGPARAVERAEPSAGSQEWRERSVTMVGDAGRDQKSGAGAARNAPAWVGKLVSAGIVLTIVASLGGAGYVVGRRWWRQQEREAQAREAEAARARVLATPKPVPLDVKIDPAAAHARLFFDGAEVVEVSLPRDGQRHLLRVEAEGYQPEERALLGPSPDGTADGDSPARRTVNVALKKLKKKGGKAAPSSEDAAEAARLQKLIQKLGDEMNSATAE